MADGIEEERKPEHFRRKLTLRVEPPPKEYSNDEFLPLPDPEERDEDEADELLRESLIEQGKDACLRVLVKGRTPTDERQIGSIVDGEDNAFTLPPMDEGGCLRFRLSTTPRASSVLEAPSATALEALVKFMREDCQRTASAEEALKCVDARLAPVELPDPKADGRVCKITSENVLSILLPRLVDDEGAEALMEPLSTPQQSAQNTAEVGETPVRVLRGAQREI